MPWKKKNREEEVKKVPNNDNIVKYAVRIVKTNSLGNCFLTFFSQIISQGKWKRVWLRRYTTEHRTEVHEMKCISKCIQNTQSQRMNEKKN